MKKILALLLALCMVLALAACGKQPAAEPTEEPVEEPAVMSYAEYVAAEVDSPVVIKAAVQATQSWWNDQITVYAADPDGAYFLYNMACSEEDAAKLVPGQWIVVTGFKSEWSGEVEVVDATFTFADDEAFVADPVDATAAWGTDDLANYMNQLVVFRGVTVEAYDETGAAFAYKDPEGKTDDLYFKVSKDGVTYDFCVEFYLCGKDTDVYKSVEALQVGDVIDIVGFLYWYNGPNLQATGVKPADAEAEPTEEPEVPVEEPAVMSYAEYAAAELDSPVVIKAAVQATQSWWNDKITVYTADQDGAYFIYELACSEEDAARLVPGQWIVVTGFKSEWSGEVEVVDATFTFADDEAFVADPVDTTAAWGTDDLANYMNQLVVFRGVTVEAYDETGAAFAYKDPEGKTDDLYFKVSKDGVTYDFCVEFYLCGKDTDVYKSVEALQVGDVIDIVGFLYWYNGPNLQATGIKPADAEAEPIVEHTFMSYAEYLAAEVDSPVTVLAAVQATQSWWNDQITVYAADPDGAYFLYNMACSEEDAARLVPGQWILVNGFKGEWAGEIEIVDATFEFVDTEALIVDPVDATEAWGTDDMANYMNQLVTFTGVTVEAYDESGAAFAYKDPEGKTDDLYFKVSKDGVTYEFCVEFYLCGSETEVYQAVENLQVGDVIDLTGFLYWYNGPNLQATAVK